MHNELQFSTGLDGALKGTLLRRERFQALLLRSYFVVSALAKPGLEAAGMFFTEPAICYAPQKIVDHPFPAATTIFAA